LSNAITIKKQSKENLNTSKTMKEVTRENGMMKLMDMKTRLKAPEITSRGSQFAVFTKNLDFPQLHSGRDEIKIGCVLKIPIPII